LAQFKGEGQNADAQGCSANYAGAFTITPVEHIDMSDEIIVNALPDPEPVPPREPEAIECCGSGCVPCVYDLYWEAVARYEAELEAWQARNGNNKTGN